jgi:recombination protein RecA
MAEFDIIYGKGISKEGSLIDVGVDMEIVKKSGAWYTYEGDQLGQGKENARQFLTEHPEIALEIERKIREAVGLTAFGGEDEIVSMDGPVAVEEPVGEPTGVPAG